MKQPEPSRSTYGAPRHSVQPDGSATGHAGDCTIYASLINGTPLDGICTCGYGWECVRHDDWDKMFSAEWLEANKSPNDQAERLT